MVRAAYALALARAGFERTVPASLRRILGFDVRGTASLALWLARRRHGVPHGATAVPYAGAQTATTTLLGLVMLAELVGVEVVLRAVGAPDALHVPLLVIDGYSVLVVLTFIAACVTRPHVVTADTLRIRYGVFFDLQVPRAQITAVRRVRNWNETGFVRVDGDQLAVAVSNETNLVVELTGPIVAVRPLGGRVAVRAVRFRADDPRAALAALAPSAAPAE
jgi:hypothetical protein